MSLFHLEIDDSLWLVDCQEILVGGPRPTLADTFSFKSPQHEMYTMDDVFPG
jgi:hypothetical protein